MSKSCFKLFACGALWASFYHIPRLHPAHELQSTGFGLPGCQSLSRRGTLSLGEVLQGCSWTQKEHNNFGNIIDCDMFLFNYHILSYQ